MSKKHSLVESVEDEVKRGAKDVETFAEKVSADEEPVTFETDDDPPQADKPPAKKDSK